MTTTPQKDPTQICRCVECGGSKDLLPLNVPVQLQDCPISSGLRYFICEECFEDRDDYAKVRDTIVHIDETVMDGHGDRQFLDECYACIDCQEHYHCDQEWHETVDGDTLCQGCRESGDWTYTNDSECYVVHYDNVYHCPECSEVYAYQERAMECCGCGRGDWHCYSTNIFHEIGNYYVDIKGKDAGRVQMRKKPKHLLVYGVENEIEARHGNEALCEAMRGDCNLTDYSILKEDSSINGLELVTLPASLAAHQRHLEWAQFCENSRPSGRGHHGCGNGMHIHCDRAAIGDLTLGKLLVFFNSEHNSQLLSDIAQRPIHNSNQWCRQSPAHYNKCGKAGKNPNVTGKYSALNVTSYTVECRIFNATLVPERILKNIEFFDAVINWCRVTPVSVIEQIHCRDSFLRFVIFNRKTYPHLHEFLVKRYSPYVAYPENRRELAKKLENEYPIPAIQQSVA